MTSYFGCVSALCGNWLCTLLPPVNLIINLKLNKMANRKLEKKEIIHLSKQITELKEMHKTLVAKEIEVNPYTMLLISDNLQKAVDNYKMELQNINF